jgi:hypothetical protein
MTFFGRFSSFFRNSGSRGGSECNVMPTYSESVASIACVWFTGPCALSKDLRSRGEVPSTQPFALTWRGCPHCHTPAADRSIGKPLNVTFGSSLIRALNVPLASKKVAAGPGIRPSLRRSLSCPGSENGVVRAESSLESSRSNQRSETPRCPRRDSDPPAVHLFRFS